MKSPRQNKILLFNELMIQFISIHVLLFTDWVISEDDKFYYGWYICFWISVMILFNMQFVVRYTVRVMYLVILRQYYIIESYSDFLSAHFFPESRPQKEESPITQENLDEQTFNTEAP